MQVIVGVKCTIILYHINRNKKKLRKIDQMENINLLLCFGTLNRNRRIIKKIAGLKVKLKLLKVKWRQIIMINNSIKISDIRMK